MLNFLRDAATVMSDPNPKYGYDHGWYASFVRVNTDAIGGWTQENGLVDQAQFDGWINNFLVPYAEHLKSRGLYLVLCATGPINTPDNGAQNAGIVEQQRLRTFWSTVANAPGVKNADNIMFELMNEPVQIESYPGNGDWGSGSGTYFEAFRNWMQPVINDIRSTGANNVIWVPCLGWQGEPYGWAQYPFTGSNIGIAAHYYPAYGGVYDDATAVQNLWNSNYKPAADQWPMVITECYWFPGGTGYDDLFNGTTAGFGNALKNAMDNQGNVSFLIGFLADHLVDLAISTPENCTLGSREATQAYFGWLPTYTWAAPQDDCGGCDPTPITPYVQINDGSWNQTSSVDVNDGDQVKFGPQPVDDGWVWSGPDGFWANTREVTISNIQTNQAGTYTATYTNDCGAESYQDFYVTVNGSGGGTISEGTYNVINRNSGKYLDVEALGTSDGSNVHQWTSTGGTNQQWIIIDVGDGYYRLSPAHATSKALDVEGISTDDGANVHIWEYLSGNNQQWRFVDVGDGYYQIEARHSGKLLEIVGASTDDGGNVQQWPNNGHHCQHWSLNQLKSAFVSTGIEEAANSTAEIQIYPNPASDGNFMIQVAQIKENENLNINIFDLQGRLVYANSVNSQNRISVNTNLQKGIYILEISNGNNKYIRKLKVE
jgi:hypothetical protein